MLFLFKLKIINAEFALLNILWQNTFLKLQKELQKFQKISKDFNKFQKFEISRKI
jgi:hypothetical protein